MTETLYLFEHFFSEMPVEKEGLCVSLTAGASYALEKAGQPYRILDDYYREKELRSDEDKLFADQQEWLSTVDAFLRDLLELPSDIRFFSVHLNRLKYITDGWIIRARILRELLKKERPRRIVLYEKSLTGKPSYSIYDFTDPWRYRWQPLLEELKVQKVVCDFELEVISLPSRDSQALSAKSKISFSQLFKKVNRRLSFLLNLNKVNKRGAEIFDKVLRLLFLDEGTYAIDEPLRWFQRLGHTVWVKKGFGMENRTAHKRFDLQVNGEGKDKGRFREIFQLFVSRKLLQWPSTYAGMDLEPVLKPSFEHLFVKIFPEVLSEYKALLNFYDRHKISALVMRATAGDQYPAPLLAAQTARVPRICFQHSIGPLDMSSWALDETVFTDLNFTMHASVIPYFKRYSSVFRQGECVIGSSSHYLRKIAKEKSLPKNNRPRIFYVPTKLAHGANHFNMMYYTDTWYYEHQKALFTFFSINLGFEFIYKHSEHQRWAEDSILPWLKEKAFKNVRIESALFSELIHQADAVVFDYPSTGFFETSSLGIPVLALCHEAMRMNADMKELFGRSFQWFSSTSEALEKIKEFLDSPKESFKHPLPFPSEPDPSEMISSFIRDFSARPLDLVR